MNFDDVKYFNINNKEVAVLKLEDKIIWQRKNYYLDGNWKLGALPFVGITEQNSNSSS